MTLFLVTLLFTIILFIAAALIFNYCKKRPPRRAGAAGTACQHGSGGCACTSALQTTLRKMEDS